ncbi:MAG: zinc ribbon domain-containing protein [Gammaproteobacteria bacterium]|nr:zinc ribbon domain-containing protein [Gammaproteobacteria bacterium]
MPIYDYECTQCGHRVEVMQKFSDAPPAACPACSQPTLRKLLSAPSFHLKGSGWYQTDFKHAGQKKPADPAKSESEKPASTNSDTAEATKTPAEKSAADSTAKPSAPSTDSAA